MFEQKGACGLEMSNAAWLWLLSYYSIKEWHPIYERSIPKSISGTSKSRFKTAFVFKFGNLLYNRIYYDNIFVVFGHRSYLEISKFVDTTSTPGCALLPRFQLSLPGNQKGMWCQPGCFPDRWHHICGYDDAGLPRRKNSQRQEDETSKMRCF